MFLKVTSLVVILGVLSHDHIWLLLRHKTQAIQDTSSHDSQASYYQTLSNRLGSYSNAVSVYASISAKEEM